MRGVSLIFAAVVTAVMLHSPSAFAQATRTWVSGTGDDANPCSRTAPCKTFAGAISKTAAQGEINIIDPGAYGTVTITKSISIVAEGHQAGVLATGTTGVIINAASTDVVVLKGLDIEGAATGLNGIRFLAGAELVVQDCRIHGFRGSGGVGISVQPTTGSRVIVSRTTINANNTGILVQPAAGIVTKVFVDDVILHRNLTSGITVNGATAEVELFDSIITANLVGITTQNGAFVTSFGNNAILRNHTADGAPTSTVPLK